MNLNHPAWRPAALLVSLCPTLAGPDSLTARPRAARTREFLRRVLTRA